MTAPLESLFFSDFFVEIGIMSICLNFWPCLKSQQGEVGFNDYGIFDITSKLTINGIVVRIMI